MFKETRKAIERIKTIKDIDFKIIKVDKDFDSGYDVIQLEINESDFHKRLDLKHKIVEIATKDMITRRFYITGAI